ncbi:uncharacterized protein CcaverHIS019_0305670 [Cutaneotrichosporon cavernicola]|uniref:ATP-NAD kinase n=1 Tax=Cutaneotrichosporon cavernicola TaxID=279322 RepID=A0AA48ICR7_9TREE|nr:uncharacterized protein CcaverHIS019_0305670 [Cutaneotrichosporon cavernicola]BEI90497.1 hypothetical protein CcaverHIS019_0305670 [Cutaneotrichosporon cavernicola]BEI98271.1 hypothetical protein CcaverHIS631_0305700 [Cutaneotrichosporon cavernicola]BEJ06046.1 hypothetical protein CcaverHIS641_0305680 [Cutaneotrichosporon cavernicola]
MPQSHVNSQPKSSVPIAIGGTSTSLQSSAKSDGTISLPNIGASGTRPIVSSPLSQQVSIPKALPLATSLGVSPTNSLNMSNVHPPGPLHPPAKKKVHLSPEVDDNETPYYIHSGLDKHGALSGWLRGKHEHPPSRGRRDEQNDLRKPIEPAKQPVPPRPRRPGILKPLTPAHPPLPDRLEMIDRGYESEGANVSRFDGNAIYDDGFMEYDDDDDDDEPSSLSRQLAETAQGVREVSRELGRTRVRSRIQTILVVTKARDNRLITLTRELALYCMLRKPAATGNNPDVRQRSNMSPDRGMIVYVDNQLRSSKRFDAAGMQRDYPQLFEPIASRRRSSNSASASASSASISTMASSWSATSGSGADQRKDRGQLRYWTAEMCSNSPQLFDFVVTLGGDGTVLFTSWLFQRIVPPVLPFALGSLGFLTNFDFKQYQETLDKCIDDGIRVNLRMRFTCVVYRAVAPDASMVVGKGRKRKAIRKPGGEILIEQVDRDGWEALEGGTPIGSVDKGSHRKDKEIMCFTTRPVEQFEVLNDLVVDRGPSPFVSLLEVFGDDHHLTTVQADGLTVSTPTGSTAYSLSAGGSLVHPGIPAILITPICPHTLSFRPMLLPDGIELRVCVPYNSRSTAWASFDGRGRVELKQGDHIKITASKYPFPTVCADKQSTDWFRSIQRTLKWNERERQKSFVVVEEDHPYDPHKEENRLSDSDDEYDSDGSSEEDEFDIDDKSAGEVTPPPRDDIDTSFAPAKPLRVHTQLRHLRDNDGEFRSGVQSPDRFASSYECPPPISQRHLFDALAKVESKLRRVEIQDHKEDDNDDEEIQDSTNRPPSVSSGGEGTPVAITVPLPVDHMERAEAEDEVPPLPEGIARTESDMTLAPPDHYDRAGRRSNSSYDGGRTPRQGRSRSRSRAREVRASSNSRSGSPHVGAKKPKAFAFFGHDDSQSEVSDDE